MKYISAILVTLALVVIATAASAQDPFAIPAPPKANPSSVPRPPPPDRLTPCQEELQEVKIENATLKGKLEVSRWPTDPLVYLTIMSFPIAWVAVNFFRIVSRTTPAKPKRKEDKEDSGD